MCSKEEKLEKELYGAYEEVKRLSKEHEEIVDTLFRHAIKLIDQKNKLKEENEYLSSEVDYLKQFKPENIDDINGILENQRKTKLILTKHQRKDD